MSLQAKLETLILPIVTGLGYVLWGLEFVRHGQSATLRIFIDKPAGITLDDCEKVSRQVSAMMDVEDPIDVAYRLEVSSPGLDRSFFAYEQLPAYVGQEVRVRLHSRGMGRKRNFMGVLRQVADGNLVIEDETGEQITLVWRDVDKASLVVRFEE